MSLTRYVRRLRQSQLELEKTSVLPSTPRTVLPQRQTLTARRASYLILENPQTRRADDEQLRRRLIDLPSDANPSH